MQTQSFQKIMRELEKRIHTGIYTPESALPSRTELIAEFKVARATVERAIRELIRSGVLISRQGSGTFVAPHIEKKYRVGVFPEIGMEAAFKIRRSSLGSAGSGAISGD